MANAATLPPACVHLWADFLELHESRGSNGFAPLRIGFVEIDAWQRVNGVRLPYWQIRAIRAADDAYFVSREVKQ
nr:hypothetical protein [Sphingobium bisphenolivorans]